jgi:hypothetical protein
MRAPSCLYAEFGFLPSSLDSIGFRDLSCFDKSSCKLPSFLRWFRLLSVHDSLIDLGLNAILGLRERFVVKISEMLTIQ